MNGIVQMGKKVLRETATYIEPIDITSEKIQKIIANMNTILATQNDGVAIAAPQIGESYRIFTIAPFVFDKPKEAQLVYINPEIIKASKKTKWKHEGCLSCRWQVGDVQRHVEVTLRAYDKQGNQFTESANGLLAHIFQHEIDHLDGILFLDKARTLRNMTQEEIDEVLNK